MRTTEKKISCRSAYQKILFFICLFLTVLFVFLSRSLITAKAVSPEEAADEGRQKFYMSYEVHDGDTLWDLAGEYNDFSVQDSNAYIEEVRSMNHLSGDTIHAGVFIVLPYFMK